MEELNRSLFLSLNAGAQSSPYLMSLAMVLAEYLVDTVPLLLAALWLWGVRADRTAVLAAALSVALALVCNQAISLAYPHPRPFMIGLGRSFLAHAADPSFPSDHATVFFALGAAFLRSSWRRLGAVIILLGVAVGWARVYLGVHFPFDIVGALVVAMGSALACHVVVTSWLGTWLLDSLEAMYRRLFAPPIARGWVRG